MDLHLILHLCTKLFDSCFVGVSQNKILKVTNYRPPNDLNPNEFPAPILHWALPVYNREGSCNKLTLKQKISAVGEGRKGLEVRSSPAAEIRLDSVWARGLIRLRWPKRNQREGSWSTERDRRREFSMASDSPTDK